MKRKVLCMLIAIGTTLVSFSQKQPFNNSGYQQIRLGDLDIAILSDGYINFPVIQPIMAPEADIQAVSSILNASFLPTKDFGLGMNIMLIKKGDHLILFDTGGGKTDDQTGGKLLESLESANISPDQITDIVITHAHFDHIGGLLDGQGKSIYPNAIIYMTDIEYNFWTSNNPDFSNSKSNGMEGQKEMIQSASHILRTIKPQVKLIKDGERLFDCITISLAPGHTPGHVISEISSNGESIIHIADVVHYGAILFPHPEWGTMFDWDFDLAVQTRINTFENLSQKKALVFGYHLPYPGFGHIVKTGTNSYQWLPKPFLAPY